MQTKDYAYLALVAATAAFFYWHGYLAARSRARKTFVSIFKDSRSLAQLPPADSEEMSVPMPITHRGMRPERRSGRTMKIRAVFGVN
jgi:hypothetical protein